MDEYKFNCPHCKQSLEAPQDMLGLTIDCPTCQGKIKLPNPEPVRPSPKPGYSRTGMQVPQNNRPTPPSTEDARINKAFDYLSSIMVAGEKLEASAVQRRLFALTNRRSLVFATSGRYIGMTRGLLGGFTPQDVRWQDVKDARIRVGIFGAELTINALAAPDLAISGGNKTVTFSGLRKKEAQAVYRICQAQEQAWREKRRLRELDELRAKSGGIQLGASSAASFSPQPHTEPVDATTRLQRAKEMLDKGLINDSEYETIKARIVESI